MKVRWVTMRLVTLAAICVATQGCDALSGLDDFEVRPVLSDGGAGGAPGQPRSCAEVSGPSGDYLVDPDGPGPDKAIQVHCEQELADGGWTLVGRSADDGEGEMGWTDDLGALSLADEPYSLDTRSLAPFSEMLIVSREGAVQAFKIELPPDFVETYRAAPWRTLGAVSWVTGPCSDDAPGMLSFVGYTERDDGFFMRDGPFDDTAFGLKADGFWLNYSSCELGGGLDDKQGEIYVK